jgi:hypothetical protein
MIDPGQPPSQRMEAIRKWVRQGGMPDFNGPSIVKLTPLTDLNKLRQRVSDVQTGQELRTQPFTSDAPVFGRVIVWIRTAWNWMSTKWYVLTLVQQQNTFNASVAQAWSDLLEYLKYVVVFGREVYTQLEHLENRLSALEEMNLGASDSKNLRKMELKDVLKTLTPELRDLLIAESIFILSRQDNLIRDILEQKKGHWEFHTLDPDTTNQGAELLVSLPEEALGGLLAIWDDPILTREAVHLLDQCQRVLRPEAWAVWIWPWSATSDETNAQLARSIALEMDFDTVRLDARQYKDAGFQMLLLRR